MLTRLSVLLFATLTLQTAHAGYFPPPCQEPPPPEWFACPEPYVALMPVRQDDAFSSAWYCRSTNHSLGALRDGGSSGSRDLTMFPDWSLPSATASPTATVDLRAEI